ncbi:MAG: hypothetical protein LBK94_08700 [Prevotellaceae bacterium]|jgi:hypothetical protein|nr:hypothetical protein [Prevotellaceae bacterium]
MINFNPHKLIRQLLPTFSRKPLRLAWLDAMLSPFVRMWNEYVAWRTDEYYEAHVTCQIVSMEAYLNRLFDSTLKRIAIIDAYFDESIYVALVEENYDDMYIDGDDGAIIYLAEETTGNGFIVSVPEELSDFAPEIRGVVEKIRPLGVGYVIMLGDVPYLTVSTASIHFIPQPVEAIDMEVYSNTNWNVI